MTTTDLALILVVIVGVQVALALWLRHALAAERAHDGVVRTVGAQATPAIDAVASEVAKRQVGVLAEMAEEVRAYEEACLAHSRRFCEVMLGEWRRAGRNGIPDLLPNDLEGAMRTFARLGDATLDANAQARIHKDLEPNTTVLLAYADQTCNRLEQNRFWLGQSLEQELRAYVNGMAHTFADLQPAPGALRSTQDRYRALVSGHPEASRAIARLSSISAPARPGA